MAHHGTGSVKVSCFYNKMGSLFQQKYGRLF
jgi:hypothetical protein